MKIVDAEPNLIEDIVNEIEVIEIKEKPSLTVRAGIHPMLGKVVVIKSEKGDSLIVEVDE